MVMPDGLFKNVARGGVYYGSFTAKDGTRKQFSTGSKNEREARQIFRAKLQAVLDEEDRPKLKLIYLSKFAEEYLASRRGEQISKAQLDELRASLAFFHRALGDVPIHTITVADCERFVTRGWTPEGWPSLWTSRKHYTNLKAAFGAAKRWEHVRENPFDRIKKPKPEERLPDVFTRRELARLLDSLPEDTYYQRRLKNTILLAVNTGLRLGECLHLERRDIDFERLEVYVRAKKDWSPKGRKSRVVPLSEDATKALRSQLMDNARNDNERVRSSSNIFPGPHGLAMSLNVIEKPYALAVKALFPERELDFHALRHTFGSFLCEAGVPLQVIQKIMGHASVKTTEIYARLRGNNFSSALNALNGVPSLIRPVYQTPEGSENQVPVWEEIA